MKTIDKRFKRIKIRIQLFRLKRVYAYGFEINHGNNVYQRFFFFGLRFYDARFNINIRKLNNQ